MRKVLMPREHGAYAQLAFPILSGLLVARSSAAGYALALAAIACFLSYEPGVVLLGARGVRLQREHARAARRQLYVLAVLAAFAGVLGFLASPPQARLLMLVPAGAAVVLLPLFRARRVKSVAGEVLVALAFAGMHLPIAAAGGAVPLQVWGPGLVWFSGFLLATLAVHAIKSRHKRQDGRIAAVVTATGLAVSAVILALVMVQPSLRGFGLSVLLPVAAALVVNALRVHPRRLKRVGWSLVAANTATLILLLQL